MAPLDDKPDHPTSLEGDENPFVAFRKYADETMSSIFSFPKRLEDRRREAQRIRRIEQEECWERDAPQWLKDRTREEMERLHKSIGHEDQEKTDYPPLMQVPDAVEETGRMSSPEMEEIQRRICSAIAEHDDQLDLSDQRREMERHKNTEHEDQETNAFSTMRQVQAAMEEIKRMKNPEQEERQRRMCEVFAEHDEQLKFSERCSQANAVERMRPPEPPTCAFDDDVRKSLVCPYRPGTEDTTNGPRQHLANGRCTVLGLPQRFIPGPGVPSHMFGLNLPLMRGDFPRIFDQSGKSFAWPVAYVLFSPYSPLQLECQKPFRDHGPKWRNAFEDLVAVQSGMDISISEPSREKSGSANWIESMIEKGMFEGWTRLENQQQSPSRERVFFGDVDSRHPENDAAEDEVTELDLYEHFLATQYPSSSKKAKDESSKSSVVPNASTSLGSGKLGIISTLTTTERSTLPDGTVHTKISLKKRFADGREESSETVHTTQGTQTEAKQSSRTPIAESTTDQSQRQKQEKNRKGWFWS